MKFPRKRFLLVRASLVLVLALPATVYAQSAATTEKGRAAGVDGSKASSATPSASSEKLDFDDSEFDLGAALTSEELAAEKVADQKATADEKKSASSSQSSSSVSMLAPKTSNARYLTMDEAKTAFGDEFSVRIVNGQVLVDGGTAEKFRSNFVFTNFYEGDKLKLKIYYDGKNDEALNFGNVKKEDVKFITLQDNFDGGMIKLSKSIKSIEMVSPNAYSSKKPWNENEFLNEDGELVSYVSPEDIARKKKLEEAEKGEKQNDLNVLLVTKCHRGLSELDVGSEALAQLLKANASVQEKIANDKGEDWLSEQSKKFTKEVFEACRTQMLRGKLADISKSECDSRLVKIGNDDDSYVVKIKGLYFDLSERYLNTDTMGVQEAYEASIAALGKVRSFQVDEKDEASEERKIKLAEDRIQAILMGRSVAEGSKSESFEFMRGKALENLIALDTNECLIPETGYMLPNMMQNPLCAEMRVLSYNFIKQSNEQLRVANQNAELITKQNQYLADQQNCAALRAGGVPLQAGEEAKCKAIELAVAANAKAAANESIGNSAAGYGEIVKTPETATNTAGVNTNTSSESGFLNSAYTSTVYQKAAQPTASANVGTQSPRVLSR